jgi:Polyketide cyclase / dehydrase and lipid transport
VDVTAELDARCSAPELFEWIEDLERYPSWLDIVPRARSVGAVPDDDGPAWRVDLRGRIGPLARSKRLRMVRTRYDPVSSVRFERREIDGRRHADWVLDAEVVELDDGCRLVMHLHYGGSFGGRILERMLGDEIRRSRARLQGLVEAS